MFSIKFIRNPMSFSKSAAVSHPHQSVKASQTAEVAPLPMRRKLTVSGGQFSGYTHTHAHIHRHAVCGSASASSVA